MTGKWSKIPLEQRLCTLCDKQEVESEIHFIFDCPYYKHLRETMIQNMKEDNINFNNGNLKDQLNLLFLNGSLKLLNIFGQYIKEAFEQRDKPKT